MRSEMSRTGVTPGATWTPPEPPISKPSDPGRATGFTMTADASRPSEAPDNTVRRRRPNDSRERRR
jgi:hypothetical protein